LKDIFSALKVSLLFLHLISLDCEHSELNIYCFVALLPIFDLKFKLLIRLGCLLIAPRHIRYFIITILDLCLPIFDIFVQFNLNLTDTIEFFLFLFSILFEIIYLFQKVIVLVANFELLSQVPELSVRHHKVVDNLPFRVLDSLAFIDALYVHCIKLTPSFVNHL